MEARALLLNASFQPLQVISWQKALQLFFSGKVEIVESSDRVIRSVTLTIRIPVVIRLLKYIPPIRRKNVVKLSRKNILLRDHFTCQYCGKKPPQSQLTLDHVVPIVKGGPKTWENLVTACRTCNVKKGGRTPDEASMKLMKTPKQPIWLPMLGLSIDITHSPEYIRLLVSHYTHDGELEKNR